MPASDYDRLCSLDNLRRAYRWTLSNPDAKYKEHFRDAYAAYAASSEANLKRLRRELRRNAYEPMHSSKVYFPKPSGILRPYSLLTVNDQIVYQACANVVAEKLRPKTKHRYQKTIFGHLYAGKRSKFFYLKWQDGYRAFSDAVENNIDAGYQHVANFDLASFYDSIDHHVLKHFLGDIGVEEDFIEFLLTCLKQWTSNTWTSLPAAIYHEHGIPQGPLASGIISEVVLKHIDERGARAGRVKYIRYVDDIKLFAKDETVLRQRLIGLDLASKEIGLFPQSAKVNIRKVTNALEEIKSVSRPPESSVVPMTNQTRLRRRILELTRRGKVDTDKSTRFKYLLARVEPHHSLNTRLLKVLVRQPAFYYQVTTYFSNYKKLPAKSAEEILRLLRGDEVYHAVRGSMLFAVLGNMQEPHRSRCVTFCYRRLLLPSPKLPAPQPTYEAALTAWVLSWNRLTYAEFSARLKGMTDWWVAKDVLKYLHRDQYGKASFQSLLNNVAHKQSAEPARVAALKIEDDGLSLRRPHKKAHEAARLLLHASGKIRAVGRPDSMVPAVLTYVVRVKTGLFDWHKFFGAKHAHAEHIAFTIKRNFESDINACIVTLDSFCDLIWEEVFERELPTKKYGAYGSMLKHAALIAKYPVAATAFYDLHQLRLQSVTAHPRNKGATTRRLKHYDYRKMRPRIEAAIRELITVVTL